jgi:hypothetical protein
MVVPVAARSLAAVAGGALVIAAWTSVLGTLIVPRRTVNWLTRWTDWIVNRAFIVVVDRIVNRASIVDGGEWIAYGRSERVLVAQGPMSLIVQFVAWLGLSFIGFTLLLWPFLTDGITRALTVAGSSMTGVGLSEPTGTVPPVILFAAAASGLVIVAPQIAYLPTLYQAYNRRETEVSVLASRAGMPAWGPELLARTYYALGSGRSTLETLPGLYAQWERWALDVADTHTAYPPLVRFRSSRRLTSWVTSLLAVLDSAALFLALAPESAPTVPARLCLRGGFVCFTEVAQAMGFDLPDEPDPARGLSLTYQEFLDAVARLRLVGFPIERDPAEAWPDFIGWRVNYEGAAYAVAKATDAVPALWSGPRRTTSRTINPIRPSQRDR